MGEVIWKWIKTLMPRVCNVWDVYTQVVQNGPNLKDAILSIKVLVKLWDPLLIISDIRIFGHITLKFTELPDARQVLRLYLQNRYLSFSYHPVNTSFNEEETVNFVISMLFWGKDWQSFSEQDQIINILGLMSHFVFFLQLL